MIRFIWQGVLAFDRLGSRIPQLIQIWLIEFFFVMSLAFFIGKIVDIRGAFGVPGVGGSIPMVFWGALVLAVITGFFVLRTMIRPRLVEGEWVPAVGVPIGDGIDAVVPNRRATVRYEYLTSHPSYALLLLLTLPLPLSMWYFSLDEGDDVFFSRVTGIVGMMILGALAVMRVLAWYALRFKRGALSPSTARIGWEIAWKPVLMLVVVCYAVVCIPLAVMFAQDAHRVAGWPEVTAGATPGQLVRVRGSIAQRPVYWAPHGTGRGGNNYAGAGVVLDLPTGGQALLLAESMTVSDFVAALRGAHGGPVATQGQVIGEITADQRRYYGFDAADFGDPPPGPRVLVLLKTP
ncbi:hypothetical protein PT015_11290 [Candidatus Mycobacterium wuenschmannii]|uniref:Transmembrane protein n=1 Tax=Candidatus Mycobacterium wuenschmannii TaxID=3027808 RepID=A0ABY8W855_9MYCO|nr:hypothetical protein [Candidatus Mycobacterium wuenschmannii]WIM89949.1 hypothetical protein PT015_11290 [Candidatus Mycobacterium wuenschmannii]